MKITRMLLIRQLDTLYQIKNICKQTDIKDCDKCPFDGVLCGRIALAPERWDLDKLIKIIIEWEDNKYV